MAKQSKLADVPLEALVEAFHAAAQRELGSTRAADREAARQAGLGQWSRVTPAEPVPVPEAEAKDEDAQWLGFGADKRQG